MQKKKLLLIDDEKDLCRITKINLEARGLFDVTLAYSGEEGIEKASKGQFDLIITDYKMPGLDGKAVLEAVKKMSQSPPVLIFSIYYDDDAVIDENVRMLADGLLHKPWQSDELVNMVTQILAKRT